MAKPMFCYFAQKSTFTGTSDYLNLYNKSIVFLEDTQEIFTHGKYFGIPTEYKGKVDSLESAMAALLANPAFTLIKVGSTTLTAATNKQAVTFAGGTGINVSLDTGNQTVTIASTYTPTVTGIKSGDKVLALDGTELTSTLTLAYDNSKITLKGKEGVLIGEVDCSDFIIDGMLDESTYYDDATHTLHLILNDDGENKDIPVDLSKLVDVYDGSNLKLKSISVPETYTEPTATDSVDSAISALIKAVRDFKANYVSAAATLTAGNLVVGDGDKKVKTFANSGTKGQMLITGNDGLEWATPVTIKDKDGNVITELLIDDDEEEGSLLTKETADELYATKDELSEAVEGIDLTPYAKTTEVTKAIEDAFAWEEL